MKNSANDMKKLPHNWQFISGSLGFSILTRSDSQAVWKRLRFELGAGSIRQRKEGLVRWYRIRFLYRAQALVKIWW